MIFTDTNTTYFYEKIWYFSLNFFLQHFLAAVSLHRFINNTVSDDSSLSSTKSKNNVQQQTQILQNHLVYKKKGVSVNPSFG
jgi:hypothetical protein